MVNTSPAKISIHIWKLTSRLLAFELQPEMVLSMPQAIQWFKPKKNQLKKQYRWRKSGFWTIIPTKPKNIPIWPCFQFQCATSRQLVRWTQWTSMATSRPGRRSASSLSTLTSTSSTPMDPSFSTLWDRWLFDGWQKGVVLGQAVGDGPNLLTMRGVQFQQF